ncbi:MAG TPA: hypothetical protein VN519_12935 [Bryobacteraceae bacterium]|nr:hypothetical protein [Bryobacteraceae bacterium]
MRITGTNSIEGYARGGELNQLQRLRSHLRVLGDAATGTFSVVRDPTTQRFIVQLIDPESQTVIDQFPAENIVKRLADK